MKTIPMPDLSDDDEADAFYNSGRVASMGTRNVHDALDSIDNLLREHHGLEIGQYDNGDSDYLITILPFQEPTVTLYEVKMTLRNRAYESTLSRFVEAQSPVEAVIVANRVEPNGEIIKIDVTPVEVPESRKDDYLFKDAA